VEKCSTELALGEILGLDTLDECCHTHQQYIVITNPSPTNIQPANNGPNSKPDCRLCIDLRTLVHDMLNEGRGMHDFINGCESSADAAVNANVRKAASLHQLHELALLKELQSEPRTLSSAMATALKKKPGRTGEESQS